jgi:hypothetical protein
MANINKTFATVLGAVLLLVGILGFFQQPEVLGIFGVNNLHNWVHVLSGALGLVAGLTMAGKYARSFNIGFGAVYALVAVLGLLGILVPELLNADMADNWLHVAIAVASLGVGFFADKRD